MSAAFNEAAQKVRDYLTHLDGHGTARDAERNLEIMIKKFAEIETQNRIYESKW